MNCVSFEEIWFLSAAYCKEHAVLFTAGWVDNQPLMLLASSYTGPSLNSLFLILSLLPPPPPPGRRIFIWQLHTNSLHHRWMCKMWSCLLAYWWVRGFVNWSRNPSLAFQEELEQAHSHAFPKPCTAWEQESRFPNHTAWVVVVQLLPPSQCWVDSVLLPAGIISTQMLAGVGGRCHLAQGPVSPWMFAHHTV